jgi:hypothetical protein
VLGLGVVKSPRRLTTVLAYEAVIGEVGEIRVGAEHDGHGEGEGEDEGEGDVGVAVEVRVR